MCHLFFKKEYFNYGQRISKEKMLCHSTKVFVQSKPYSPKKMAHQWALLY